MRNGLRRRQGHRLASQIGLRPLRLPKAIAHPDRVPRSSQTTGSLRLPKAIAHPGRVPRASQTTGSLRLPRPLSILASRGASDHWTTETAECNSTFGKADLQGIPASAGRELQRYCTIRCSSCTPIAETLVARSGFTPRWSTKSIPSRETSFKVPAFKHLHINDHQTEKMLYNCFISNRLERVDARDATFDRFGEG